MKKLSHVQMKRFQFYPVWRNGNFFKILIKPKWITMWEALFGLIIQSRNTTKLNLYHKSYDEQVIPLSNKGIPFYPVWRNGNFFKILIKPEWIMMWEAIFGFINQSRKTTKLNQYQMSLDEEVIPLSNEEIPVYPV